MPEHGFTDDEVASIHRLCARHGIATAYEDAFGVRHTVTSKALAALLLDAGFVGRGPPADFAAAEAAAEAATWHRALPSTLVIASGSASLIAPDVRLPASTARIEWRLVEEHGAVHEGVADTKGLHITQHADLDGIAYARCELPIPLALPDGYHRLSLAGLPGECLLICAPAQCHRPPLLDQGRAWGFTLQLYGLRSGRNWGIGDFSDLKDFVALAAHAGADFVGLNPLHALFPHDPARTSPYSPSSRAQLNVLYIDVEAVTDFADCAVARQKVRSPAFQARLAELREASLVDYAGVAALKHEVLTMLHGRFAERDDVDPEVREFGRFREHGGEPLRQHALFEALQAHFHAADASVWGWPVWPEPFRNPASPAVANFAKEHGTRIAYFEYLQWQAARQLQAVAAQCAASGKGIGLYLDLAVSADRSGSDAWRHQQCFAGDVRVGAPPDAFNLEGQNWGLPPLRPDQLREMRYQPFIEALRANMHEAGAIRIDHVMILMRLFWIPAEGAARDGAYVSYPVDELFAILALESRRHRCLVIGEDLGTVPESMRDTLRRYGVLSYRVLYFENNADGAFRPPAHYPRDAIAAVSTHDLATLAGWWSAHDLQTRFQLGLIADPSTLAHQTLERSRARARLKEAIQQQAPELANGLGTASVEGPLDADGIAAVHGFLAGAPSKLMAVQLEDALGNIEQANLPGTVDEHPNWRRKYAPMVDAIWREATVKKVCAAMVQARPLARERPAATSNPPLRVPRATYRLQLHGGFGFDDAARIVPYLARLGVSHVYCSPIHRARPGSMHGYDVVAHDEINPELGGMPAFEHFTRVLKQHGMGQLIDLVPNHMGVLGTDNRWWMDVLENGMASPYACHFDIQWQGLAPGLTGKVLLPVLGDHYGQVLERGELHLRWYPAEGAFGVSYFDHRFPLGPQTLSLILDRAAGRAEDTDTAALLAAIAESSRDLPVVCGDDAEAVARRARDKQLLVGRLAALEADSPPAALAVYAAVRALNDADQREALHGLLEAQAYRLAHWRTAADEINYRRFFDVNELAALRTEREEVFKATHALALNLAARGWVDGLRIDHPDGLQDPAGYFDRLQDGYVERVGTKARGTDALGRPECPLYVVAEKIAAPHEDVPVSWAIQGTTGYRFANLANAVLIDHRAADRLSRIWREFTGMRERYEDVVFLAKREVAQGTLASDLEVLAHALLDIAKGHHRTRDLTLNTLREAIATVAACMTVYRTYNAEEASAQDLRYIDQAIDAARERLQLPDPSVFGFLRNALLGLPADGADSPQREAALRFARRFQQFSAPVAAKGVEDTAFYRYFPLSAVNEVGGEPDRIGIPVAEFHVASDDRQKRWPHTMLATSTHDSKRSEDVRLRIDVLSECPGLWRLALRKWRTLNAPLRGSVTPMHEYLLYQTLLGTMPAADGDMAAHDDYVARIVRYMLKAAREGKAATSWMRPDTGYEEALEKFVRGILATDPANTFLADLSNAVTALDRYGALNDISLTLLKFSSPGVPDIYQGCELIERSLVDPDNRRAVDYEDRQRRLDELEALAGGADLETAVRSLAEAAIDGRAKLWLTWRLLGLRAREPRLLGEGSYVPLEIRGAQAHHLIAFLRYHEGRRAVVLAVRLFASLNEAGRPRPPDAHAVPPPEAWRDTRLVLPTDFGTHSFEDCITGARHTLGAGEHAVSELLRAFPGTLLLGGI